MARMTLSITAMLVALAGCSPAPESSPSAADRALPAGSRDDLRPVQAADRPAITAEKIKGDLVGRKVEVSDISSQGPDTEWTFEADEFKQVEILERHATEQGLTVDIYITTRNNPKPDEDSVQVSGKLQLHYEWRLVRWVLTRVDNLTFRYSVGVST